MQPLLNLCGKTIVGLDLISGSSPRKRVQEIKEYSSRRLLFIRHVGLPCDGFDPVFEKQIIGDIVCASMEWTSGALWELRCLGECADRYLMLPGCRTSGRQRSMDYSYTFALKLHTNDLPLCGKERQLVFSLVTQVAQLHPTNPSAGRGRAVGNRGCAIEEVSKGQVGVLAMLVMREGLQCRTSGVCVSKLALSRYQMLTMTNLVSGFHTGRCFG